MKKNGIYTLKVEDLNAQGQGVCRVDGQVLFVPGALPGETVQTQVIKVTSRYAVGKLLSVADPSSARTEPACPYFPRCGGCTWQHMSRSLQLSQKEANLTMAFRKAGIEIDPEPIRSGEPWHYRNKGQFPAAPGREGTQIGMYAARSHRLIPIDSCLIQEEPINEVLASVRNWTEQYGISAYDERTGRGLLRHVCARHVSGQTVAVLVVTDFDIPFADELIRRLRSDVSTLTGIVLNLNRQRDNRIYGDVLKTLWGRETIVADLMGIKLGFSVLSFLQVNTEGMKILYDTVSEFADVKDGDTVYDAYCGVGSIGLCTAANAGRLFGVEEVEAAVENARDNATRNGIGQAEYVAGKAEEVFPQFAKKGITPDVLIVDPPFKGCHESFLQALVQTGPRRLVYVSCNPATLARDVAYLYQYGYQIQRIRPVDLFAQSDHVETVCLLTHS